MMSGIGSNQFAPTVTTNRAMVAQILYNLEGQPDISQENQGYPYADVNGQAWYGDAVYWARLNGVAAGYENNTFRPNQAVTREELAQRAVWDVQELAAGCGDLAALAQQLARNEVVIATEVGGGVVPVDKNERAAREAAGRLGCLLAQRADAVVRVFCGIPVYLKGAPNT